MGNGVACDRVDKHGVVCWCREQGRRCKDQGQRDRSALAKIQGRQRSWAAVEGGRCSRVQTPECTGCGLHRLVDSHAFSSCPSDPLFHNEPLLAVGVA